MPLVYKMSILLTVSLKFPYFIKCLKTLFLQNIKILQFGNFTKLPLFYKITKMTPDFQNSCNNTDLENKFSKRTPSFANFRKYP